MPIIDPATTARKRAVRDILMDFWVSVGRTLDAARLLTSVDKLRSDGSFVLRYDTSRRTLCIVHADTDRRRIEISGLFPRRVPVAQLTPVLGETLKVILLARPQIATWNVFAKFFAAVGADLVTPDGGKSETATWATVVFPSASRVLDTDGQWTIYATVALAVADYDAWLVATGTLP